MGEDGFSRHWSLANAADIDVTDLPMLLRAVADQIEADAITAMELLDVVVHHNIGAQVPTWTLTVYWSPDDAAGAATSAGAGAAR